MGIFKDDYVKRLHNRSKTKRNERRKKLHNYILYPF